MANDTLDREVGTLTARVDSWEDRFHEARQEARDERKELSTKIDTLTTQVARRGGVLAFLMFIVPLVMPMATDFLTSQLESETGATSEYANVQ